MRRRGSCVSRCGPTEAGSKAGAARAAERTGTLKQPSCYSNLEQLTFSVRRIRPNAVDTATTNSFHGESRGTPTPGLSCEFP